MANIIVNGAPGVNALGIHDLSIPKRTPEQIRIPTHLPKAYLYAAEGPITPQLVGGADMVSLYGADSFDMRKEYANHSTVFIKEINKTGNIQQLQRIKPADAPGPAKVRVYADVLPLDIIQYERNSDGSFTLDGTGNKIPVAGNVKLPGFKVKFVAVTIPDVGGGDGFGLGTIIPGDQTDVPTSTQSQRIPLFDASVNHFGKYGNNVALRMWAPTELSAIPVDTRLISTDKAYPIRLAVARRVDERKTAKIVSTLRAEQYVDACLKPGVVDDNTDAEMYAGKVFIPAYQDLDSKGVTPQYGPFGRFHLYDNNIADMLNDFYTAEFAAVTPDSDFTGADDEKYVFNMLGGCTSSGVPYSTFELVSTGLNTVRMTENTNIFCLGGGDGTMSDQAFADSVLEEVNEYGNLNSPLQDTARYPESIIYDSGFPLETKKALTSFIARRVDTAVVLSTHDVNGPALTATQESSLALSLKSRAQLYPDSQYYGTGVVRAVIVGRSGVAFDTQYTKRLPLSLELAVKAARYMGASDGTWKSEFNFDQAPLSMIEMFKDINVTFTPAAAKAKDWANGLNWVDYYDHLSLYFPAIRTVYDNDTSVLTSFFTMMCAVELQKVGFRAHRAFSGTSSLTNLQLVERVNKFVVDNTTGRFDGRFVITPDTYFTQADKERGYSYTLPIKMYAPNMKTVATTVVEAYRIDDLQTT